MTQQRNHINSRCFFMRTLVCCCQGEKFLLWKSIRVSALQMWNHWQVLVILPALLFMTLSCSMGYCGLEQKDGETSSGLLLTVWNQLEPRSRSTSPGWINVLFANYGFAMLGFACVCKLLTLHNVRWGSKQDSNRMQCCWINHKRENKTKTLWLWYDSETQRKIKCF